MKLAHTSFGNTGESVSVVGLGGEGVLRTRGFNSRARDVINTALNNGITYFDSARAYADSEIYYGSVWKEKPDFRNRIFQTSKSACRDRAGAEADLARSLKRLNTDQLDLWQIHDIRDTEDLRMIGAPGGALEAFIHARKTGVVRYIGVTGHHDPAILTRAVREWPVDAVLLPVNPVEEILGGFLTDTLPAAHAKGIAVIGMKIMGGSHFILPDRDITPSVLLRFALSHGITTGIVGCANPGEVKQLAEEAVSPTPLSLNERDEVMSLFRKNAPQMAYYRGRT